MIRTISFTIPDWVYNETLKDKPNKSSAIQEALLKTFWKNTKAFSEFLTRNHTEISS